MLKVSVFLFSPTLYLLVGFIFIGACQSTNQRHYDILHSTISANFAPDHRLWRLMPAKNAVYVDYSDDNGLTYSQPVRVNQQDQQISVWPENPPAIEISQSGRIYVLYYADEQQKSTSFLSYSDDNGLTFSQPKLVSDHAQSAMHYMDKMLITKDDQLYLFWHDTRHKLHDKKLGTGVLSLYYSTIKSKDNFQLENHFLSDGVCSCCRTAATFDIAGSPIIFARMIFEDGSRDHALIKVNEKGVWQPPQRVTFDHWVIEACPEQGPAIAIDTQNKTHLTWFTLGDIRQGIFYAQTDTTGKLISKPISLGDINNLPSHPDVIALKQRIILVWKEFDGEQTSLHARESFDQGETWVERETGLISKAKNSHPKLITNQEDIFLSWTSKDKGYQLLKL